MLKFFESHTLFIMNEYGNDDWDVTTTKKFENDLLELLESVFGQNCSKRLQYSRIFTLVGEAEKNNMLIEWDDINEINECLPLLEKIKIGTKKGQLTSDHFLKIIKFGDHLNLSIRQQMKIAEKTGEIDAKVKKVNENFAVVNESLVKQREDLDKHSRELQTSFMGIITIFTGIVFTLFGGLNILSQLFGRINNMAEPKVVFGSLLIGVFFALLIYIIAMGLLLFSKRNIDESKGYGRNMLIGGSVLVVLFIIIGLFYYKTPYPQFLKSEDQTTENKNTEQSTTNNELKQNA